MGQELEPEIPCDFVVAYFGSKMSMLNFDVIFVPSNVFKQPHKFRKYTSSVMYSFLQVQIW